MPPRGRMQGGLRRSLLAQRERRIDDGRERRRMRMTNARACDRARAPSASKRQAGGRMADDKTQLTRDDLIKALNDDLAREYQAIIAYVVYSQSLKGAQYMNIKDEL